MTSPRQHSLRSIFYDAETPRLRVLNQLLLPTRTEYIDVRDSREGWDIIRTMKVRGAPLIAIVAMLSLAVEAKVALGGRVEELVAEDAVHWLIERLELLKTSRPTAVNLFKACDSVEELAKDSAKQSGATFSTIIEAFIAQAGAMLQEDVENNISMGALGAEAVASDCNHKTKVSILTHCNTGSLATAGFGTALGVIRALQSQGHLDRCFATETRPYNQGARLTAYEMVTDGLPGTLICDSMASALMANGSIDAVLVGADRIAANGDTANKIGTFQLAVVAKYHSIPFYVVAPVLTVDTSISSGKDIKIEERPSSEIINVEGNQIAPDGINTWNPAFDVTPAELITAIVTNKGVVRPRMIRNEKHYDLSAFLDGSGEDSAASSYDEPKESLTEEFPGYVTLTKDTVRDFLFSTPSTREFMGTSDVQDIVVEDMDGGNINLVFLCKMKRGDGDLKSLVVKQPLPYIKIIGKSWPLTLSRGDYEFQGLRTGYLICPNYVPKVLHFDAQLKAIVMQHLPPPCIILRRGLIQGIKYPNLAEDMATFLAKTFFSTCGLHLSGKEMRTNIAKWSLNEVCNIQEQVIFTDPYFGNKYNNHTSPQLDDVVADLRTNTSIKVAAGHLKEIFISKTQAFIHGDLHIGSIMVTQDNTYVFDLEFATYGPIGFDVGNIIGHLLMAYCSQPGHGNDPSYGLWILSQAEQIWDRFSEMFLVQWNDVHMHKGSCYSYDTNVFNTSEAQRTAQQEYMRSIFSDTLGFAGVEMIRRIVGVAHIEDFKEIQDVETRARCERCAVSLATRLMLGSAEEFITIQAVCKAALDMEHDLFYPKER